MGTQAQATVWGSALRNDRWGVNDAEWTAGEIARSIALSLAIVVCASLRAPRTSRVGSLRSPAKAALDLRTCHGSVKITASVIALAGGAPALQAKKTLDRRFRRLDFMPSWVGQVQMPNK